MRQLKIVFIAALVGLLASCGGSGSSGANPNPGPGPGPGPGPSAQYAPKASVGSLTTYCDSNCRVETLQWTIPAGESISQIKAEIVADKDPNTVLATLTDTAPSGTSGYFLNADPSKVVTLSAGQSYSVKFITSQSGKKDTTTTTAIIGN